MISTFFFIILFFFPCLFVYVHFALHALRQLTCRDTECLASLTWVGIASAAAGSARSPSIAGMPPCTVGKCTVADGKHGNADSERTDQWLAGPTDPERSNKPNRLSFTLFRKDVKANFCVFAKMLLSYKMNKDYM